MDREKVIRELKAARLFFEMGSKRADGVVGNLGCKSGIKYIDDALELLKEQEPVKPTYEDYFGNKIARCGKCNGYIVRYKYCPGCGQAVKWE